MQILYVYLEFLCLLLGVFLKRYIPHVIVKQHGPTIVTTKYGRLRGSLVEFPKDSYIPLQPVEAYLGIQYSALRNNILRFIPPTSPTFHWTGIHSAWDFRPVCPQKFVRSKTLSKYLPLGTVEVLTRMTSFTKDQIEDCLHLNLYVPIQEWNETEKLPVMIFVHGESYEVGTGNAYDGSVLASYGGVIVITVNYRLGVLGFLSTGDSEAEGNYALWDLVAILYWVKENIESFGGDTNRVTLFGHGHGAALVNLLLFTKHVNHINLFNNVILQSGSAFSTWATSIDPVRCTRLIAKKVNCSHAINNTKALVECFRQKSADDLVRSVPLTPKYYTCFAPSVGLAGNLFQKGKTLEELVKSSSKFSNTKIMFGLTKKEAYSYLKQDELKNGISQKRKKQFIRTYVQNVYKCHKQRIYDILEHEYTQWNKQIDNETRRDDIMDMISDGQYKAPLIKMAQAHARTADTYLYSFGYSTSSEDYPNWSGGVHGDELPYIFGAPLVGGISPFPTMYNKFEKDLSKQMMRMWTNFAKTGDPNLPEFDSSDKSRDASQISAVRWPKYNTDTQSFIHIGKKGIKKKEYYRGKELALWLKLLPKLNEADQKEASGSHELENADDLSTFDDPDRLISQFHDIFPSPPIPPYPYTPQEKQSDAGATTEDEIETQTREYSQITAKEGESIIKSTAKPVVTPKENPIYERSKNDDDEDSNIPLSITVAVGCSLLFLNMLIIAGTFYQRKRIQKMRGFSRSTSDGMDDRNNERGRNTGATPEAVNLVHQSSDNHMNDKVVNLNHKSMTDNAPMYTSISKSAPPHQGPGGYTYSALPQKSSSPMHLHNQNSELQGQPQPNGPALDNRNAVPVAMSVPYSRQPGPNSTGSGSDRSDRSPKVDTRVKHIPRTSAPVTSNNAITIV